MNIGKEKAENKKQQIKNKSRTKFPGRSIQAIKSKTVPYSEQMRQDNALPANLLMAHVLCREQRTSSQRFRPAISARLIRPWVRAVFGQ